MNMLTLRSIMGIGRMMQQCGEGPLQTEALAEGPALRRVDKEKKSTAVQFRYVFAPNGVMRVVKERGTAEDEESDG